MKHLALLCVLLPGLAWGQSEPIPGYFEQQVAFCGGWFANLTKISNSIMQADCTGKANPFETCAEATDGYNQELAKSNMFRDYLFTAFPDVQTNEAVPMALMAGYSAFSFTAPAAAVVSHAAECKSVLSELPY
jgi:hypothetical protein